MIRDFFSIHGVGVHIIVFLVLVVLVGNLVFLNFNFLNSDNKTGAGVAELIKPPQAAKTASECGQECQKAIEEEIAKLSATLSAEPTTTTVIKEVSKSAPRTTFIPLSGDASTQNTDWTDVKGSDVYISLGDYNNPWFGFDATIKIEHGNGKAFARLFDVTHGIGVINSEVSTTSDEFTVVSGESLPLWAGNNLYRVQIKSLNGFKAYFDSGRVKIVTK